MRLKKLIEEYARIHKMAKIEEDERGVFNLLVNGKNILSLENSLDGVGFFVYSVVGNVSKDKEAEICVNALEGNLFGRETGRACLGYDEKEQLLILFQYFLEETTDYPTLEKNLSLFIDYLFLWMEKLQSEEKPSLKPHLSDLEDYKKMKIFFA